MLKIEHGQIVGNTAPNIYQHMKPWRADNGAARWIIDNELGQEFVDSDGTGYKIRLRTSAELTAAAAGDAPATEQKRLQAAFGKMESHGILTLDNKGGGEVSHGLSSKWYAVSVTPLDSAMPDIHVTCQRDRFAIKGGAKNGRVTYAVTLVFPPKGRENQILTDPH